MSSSGHVRRRGKEPDVKALEDMIAALGEPVFVRTLGAASKPPLAAIARWRHGAALVDVARRIRFGLR
jgi:hypothetical protein